MSTADDVLRRRFIAIATGTFSANATYPQLDVASEVETVAGWLMDAALADRRFSDEGFEPLAHDPDYSQIRELLTNGEFTAGDAVVLYVTGHGRSELGAHWVVLHDSEPGKLSLKSLATADLIRWLAAYRDLRHVMVIIDLCQAGDVVNELPAALQQVLPDSWFVMLTARTGTEARLGAFSGVLKSLISDIRAGAGPGGNNDVEPYLNAPDFISELSERLSEQHHQKLIVTHHPWHTSICLPNPRYRAAELATVATSPARRDLALLQSALDTHWLRRAPVTSERGWVFTGRRMLMSRLIEFADGPPGTLIVAGRAGSGKSAVLARLVTCSDTSFRRQYSEVLARAEPIPPPDSVDVAVLATGKTPDQIARQIAEALGATAPAGPGLDEWIDTIRPALWRSRHPVTIVIDGLDEASDPAAVALTLLERLNPPESPIMRLIIGVRSAGSAAAADHGGRELADLITGALQAQRLRSDADEFWEQRDLADYAGQLLARGATPSAHQADLARRIAARSGRSYLLAGLAARNLAESSAGEVGDARLREVLESGISDLVLEDARSSITDPIRRDKALRLLRAAGLSFGRGIPWRDLWTAAATALDQARPVIRDDVDWLLRHRISGYLIRDLEDDAATYRLFHDELKEALAEGWPGTPSRVFAHRAITSALLTAAGWTAGSAMTPAAPAYVRRHLASHAAEAGILDEVLEAGKLPYLDHVRLAELMRLTQPQAQSSLWMLLGAWRSVRHRLSWEDPRANVAALDTALVIAGMPPPRRSEAGLSWTPRWAEWLTGGTVVGALSRRHQPFAAFGSLEGRSMLAAGGYGEVQVWEAATGRAVGRPFAARGDVVAVTMGGDDGALLAAIGRSGHLTIWDAATRARWHDIDLPDEGFRSLAMGRLHDRWLIAAAGSSGLVFTHWADSGEPARPPFPTAPGARALAIAPTWAGPVAAVGHSDGTVATWNLDRGERQGGLITVGAEVSSVDLHAFDGYGTLLAFGTSDGQAGVWDTVSPHLGSAPWQHHGYSQVRAVALGLADGVPMLAAGCLDGTVHVSPASRPEVGAILPHPDAVTTVEFGDADGRTMLATACVDGNIRLWDPVQPSAPRATVNGRIGSVALVARGRTVDVVTGNDQAKLHWWSGDDGRRRLEIDLAQTRLGTRNDPAWSPRAAVAAGYVDGRLIALTSCLNAVKCWELGDPERDQPRAMRTYEGRSAALYVGNGRALFARTKASAIVVYDAFTGRQTQLGPMSGIRLPARFDGLKFHTSRGRIFLTVVANGRLTLLDFEHQTLADAPVEGVAADAYIALGTLEGRPVLAILRPYELRLCDAASGKDQIAPIRTSPTARAVAFARLGQRDIVVTAHSATIRAWNPFTGRMLTQLPLGTNLDAMAVCDSPDGTAQVAIGGPGLLLAQLHEAQAGR